MLTIEKTETTGAVTLKLQGEVDASSSLTVDQAISKEVEAGVAVLFFDLSELDYISSAGLGVFMSYQEEFKTRGIQSALFGLNSKVRQVFDVLGLDQLLTIAENREQALAELN